MDIKIEEYVVGESTLAGLDIKVDQLLPDQLDPLILKIKKEIRKNTNATKWQTAWDDLILLETQKQICNVKLQAYKEEESRKALKESNDAILVKLLNQLVANSTQRSKGSGESILRELGKARDKIITPLSLSTPLVEYLAWKADVKESLELSSELPESLKLSKVATFVDAPIRTRLRQWIEDTGAKKASVDSWFEYFEAIRKYDDSESQIRKEMQKSKQYTLKMTVDEFYNHIVGLGNCLQVHSWREREIAEAFLNGLDNRIQDRVDVEYRKHLRKEKKDVDKEELLSLAKDEERIQSRVQKEKKTELKTTNTPAKVNSVAKPLVVSSRPSDPNSTNIGATRAKYFESKKRIPDEFVYGPISEAGRAYCRENGACTFCRCEGHLVRDCQCPGFEKSRYSHLTGLKPNPKISFIGVEGEGEKKVSVEPTFKKENFVVNEVCEENFLGSLSGDTCEGSARSESAGGGCGVIEYSPPKEVSFDSSLENDSSSDESE